MTTPEESSFEHAATRLLNSFTASRSRRGLLKGAVAGTAGVSAMAAGAGLMSIIPALAAEQKTRPNSVVLGRCLDDPHTIFSVARTAEQLAVTFYSNGLAHAGALGLTSGDVGNIEALVFEEQIHLNFFIAAGGESLASTFSFPHGAATFTNLADFIATQQQLEGVFDSAFLAAVKEFADQHMATTAQVAAQIASVEAQHYTVGRQIGVEHGLGEYFPLANWVYAPVLVKSVSNAVEVAKNAGYLSPTAGNSYAYHPYTGPHPAVLYASGPFSESCA